MDTPLSLSVDTPLNVDMLLSLNTPLNLDTLLSLSTTCEYRGLEC